MKPLRVLYLRRATGGADAGDSIYEKRLLEALRAMAQVDAIDFTRRGKLRRLTGSLRYLALPDQTAFGRRDELAKAETALATGNYDVCIVGHEYLDLAARRLAPAARKRPTPLISLRHNVTSGLMASVLGGFAGATAAALWRAQERATLNSSLYSAITAISHDDQALLAEIAPRQDVTLILPGPPPAVALVPDAPLRRELVVGGTFDWAPKKNDLRRFVAEFVALPEKSAPVFAEPSMPAAARAALGAQDAQKLDYGAAMRFGIITDRFNAGHKLKTSAYLQSNCIVLTFADVKNDFAFYPARDDFILKLGGAADIGPALARLSERPESAVRAGLTDFKTAIKQNLAWALQGALLVDLVKRVAM